MAPDSERLRVAAAGDIHCREADRERVAASLAAAGADADLILLAGDLTSHGAVEEADVLAAAAGETEAPVVAVLGNHDLHGNEPEGVAGRLREAGVIVLDREATVLDIAGVEVGVVGCKGFVGGFAPRHLPDFGEPSLRAVYAETGAEAEALDRGLRRIATCPLRIALLHYSPVEATLAGEPREILPFLGSDRLAAPILEHGPDLVLHGHAHEGAPRGEVGEVPVRNVSQPVLGGGFWTQTLTAASHSPIP